MSPGNTMMRVYAEISARVVGGDFAPGERLDPTRLAVEHAASATPVRDALHRLTGERLLETFHQEGFRVPIVTEATLRDLYHWGLELISLVGKATHSEFERINPAEINRKGVDVGDIMVNLSSLSPNYEHRAATVNFVQRTKRFRRVEFVVVGDHDAVVRIADAMPTGAGARLELTAFYKRRLRHVSEIAALLRPRGTD